MALPAASDECLTIHVANIYEPLESPSLVIIIICEWCCTVHDLCQPVDPTCLCYQQFALAVLDILKTQQGKGIVQNAGKHCGFAPSQCDLQQLHLVWTTGMAGSLVFQMSLSHMASHLCHRQVCEQAQMEFTAGELELSL